MVLDNAIVSEEDDARGTEKLSRRVNRGGEQLILSGIGGIVVGNLQQNKTHIRARRIEAREGAIVRK